MKGSIKDHLSENWKKKKNNLKLWQLWRVLMITIDPPSDSVKSMFAHYQSSRMALYDVHHTPAVQFGRLSHKRCEIMLGLSL